MKSIQESIQKRPVLGWLLFFGTLIAVFLIGILSTSIIERRSEAVLTLQVVKPIAEWEPRNETWGENFPREFESYKHTADSNFKSKYGGSAPRDYLETDPNLVVLFAGYAFSKDFKQGRGHYQAIEDITQTLRTVQPQPGTCWSCKSTDVPRLMNKMGIAEFYKSKWSDLGGEVRNPIGCQDCHDPKTMRLRITRPALVEALQQQGRDVQNVSHQEMRTLVCAQCHVEYYFKGEGKYLTFPWQKGTSAEAMESYYDNTEFSDWTHALSRAQMIKCQHPDYELYSAGVHADRNVSCADCHMPYRSEGGVKFTDHHIQSPLNNIANSCQICHRESEEKLRQNVYSRQDKIEELKLLAEGALVKAHIEAKTAWDNGATAEEMKPVLTLLRHAQWRWDWVAAANSVGFHAPLEASRILGSAIDKAQTARVQLNTILLNHKVFTPITMPDIGSKEKAQKYINLDMQKTIKDKEEFLKNKASQWSTQESKKNNK